MEIRRHVREVLMHFANPANQGDPAAMYQAMGGSLRYMYERWRAGLDIDYGVGPRRYAFLCSHVPVNADSLAWIMESKCYALTRFMLRKLSEPPRVLRVWAFGGGPGTEMFSINHQLERAELGITAVAMGEELPRVEFTACDRFAGWQPIFERMLDQLYTAYAEKAGPRRFKFHPAPALLLPPAGPLPTGDPPDLFLINYVLSENKAGLAQTLQPIVDAAQGDALFVMCDVMRPVGTPFLDAKAFLEGLGLHIEWPRQHAGAVDICYQYDMPFHEDRTIMNPFYDGIKDSPANWNLRQNSHVFWIVASKNTPHHEFPVD